jgi:hypothetical protein
MMCGPQNAVRISFTSNGVNTASGFVIRWDWIRLPETTSEPPPLAGWYFNSSKLAMRGGMNTFDNWNPDSLGFGSLVWGTHAKAKDPYSTAFGYEATAEGVGSFAVGSSRTYGAWAISMGENNAADGQNAVAIGEASYAHGDAIAIGRRDTVGIFGGVAIGALNKVYGFNSVAIGLFNKTEGTESFAAGSHNLCTAHGSSAIGYGNRASGKYSIASGYATDANGYASFVVGMFNDTLVAPETNYSPATPVFIIGNGNSWTSTSNAMIVRKDGRVGIGNDAPTELLTVGDGTGDAIRIGSVEKISDGGGQILSVNSAFVPATDNSFDLGLASLRWDDIWATNGVIQTSDARDKENIIEIENGLDKVMQLRPVTYQWKEGPDRSFQLGLIAQEVQEIIPGVVRSTNFVRDEEGNVTEEPTERLGMNYAALTPVLIKAVQELQEENARLSKEVRLLETENLQLKEALEIRIAALERRMED